MSTHLKVQSLFRPTACTSIRLTATPCRAAAAAPAIVSRRLWSFATSSGEVLFLSRVLQYSSASMQQFSPTHILLWSEIGNRSNWTASRPCWTKTLPNWDTQLRGPYVSYPRCFLLEEPLKEAKARKPGPEGHCYKRYSTYLKTSLCAFLGFAISAIISWVHFISVCGSETETIQWALMSLSFHCSQPPGSTSPVSILMPSQIKCVSIHNATQ